MNEEQSFKAWCIVELFGHVTLAGYVSEQAIGGASFIRLDVPAVDGQAEFTKLLGPSAIYSITPTSEDVARSAIEHIRARPVNVYYLPEPKAPVVDDEVDEMSMVEKKIAIDHIATLFWIRHNVPAGWCQAFEDRLDAAFAVADRFEAYCLVCGKDREHSTGSNGDVCLACGNVSNDSPPF